MSFATPGISSSSASSLIEGSSNPQRKNKRYVKKKGETRKRNSFEMNSQMQLVKESFQIDEISEKLEKVTIKSEKETDSIITKKNIDAPSSIGGRKFPDKEILPAVKEEKKIIEVEVKGKKLRGLKKDEEMENVGETLAEAGDKKDQEVSLIVNKSLKNLESEKDETNYKSLLKDFDKGKTEEEKKRDRQNARFAKAVARFSVKFTKAAIDLGIIRPNKDSASWSDSSSSSSDSCSSSCSCSDCCTTESSTCSCSECRTSSSSSGSSFSSSSTSCSTLNSSTSSTSSPTSSSSNSGITSPEKFVSVAKKFK